jgi:uncharacterized RDD family membrane protein YckC
VTSISPVQYAGFGRRLVAALIDLIMFNLVVSLIMNSIFTVTDPQAAEPSSATQFLGLILLAWAYNVVCWTRFLGTPGKLLMECQVVDADSAKALTLQQASLRFGGYFVSALSLFVGFFWILWDGRKQGFHDKIAGSVVLYNARLQTDDQSQKTLQQLMDEVR